MLSKHDASISMVIPVVTMIINSLEMENPEDYGVLGEKRALKEGMETRFSGIEETEHYFVSTLLDTRFKGCFYRDDDTLQRAKDVLTERLVTLLDKELQVRQLCKTDIVST